MEHYAMESTLLGSSEEKRESLDEIVRRTRVDLLYRKQLNPPVRLPFFNGVASLQHAIMMNSLPNVIGAYAVFGGLGNPDQDGNTCLHFACSSENIEIMAFLMNAGAKVDETNNSGQTPLMWAANSGNLNAIRFLLANGANIEATDGVGNSILLNAVQGGHLWATHYLISIGADLQKLDNAGHNCLHWAAYKGSLKLCQYFHDLNVYDINAIDSLGRTALHWAVRQGHYSVCAFLLKSGIQRDVVDNENMTALGYAKANNNKDIIKILSDNTFCQDVEKTQSIFPQPSLDNFVAFVLPCFFFMGCAFLPGVIFIVFLFGLYFGARTYFQYSSHPNHHHSHNHTHNHKHGDLNSMNGETFVAFWFGSIVSFVWMFVTSFGPVFMAHSPITTYTLMTCVSGTIFLWVKTVSTNPGIVHRGKPSDNELLRFATKGIMPDDRFCHTCMIAKPKRSKHCSVCDHCVERFDHHCIWINRDVGQENHLYFVGFLTFHTMSGLLWCILSGLEISGIFDEEDAWDESFRQMVSSAQLVFWSALYIGVICMWIGYLLFYHLKLAATNLTTNEDINKERYFGRNQEGIVQNPYDRGLKQNLVDFFLEGRVTPINRPSFRQMARFHAAGAQSSA